MTSIALTHRPERDELIHVVRFLCVGFSGVAVNFAALWLLTEIGHIHYLLSAAIATEIAIVNNFTLNHNWTFRAHHGTEHVFRKLGKFNAVALGGLAISLTSLWWLTHVAGLHYLTANLAAIGAATTWNYTASRHWAWTRARSPLGV